MYCSVFRNCVIDKSFTVKVSDHAMYCDRYQNDYYISDTKARLPIRWMSWEALLLVSIVTNLELAYFSVALYTSIPLKNTDYPLFCDNTKYLGQLQLNV